MKKIAILTDIFEMYNLSHLEKILNKGGNKEVDIITVSYKEVELPEMKSYDGIFVAVYGTDISTEYIEKIRHQNVDAKVFAIGSLISQKAVTDWVKAGANHVLVSPFDEEKIIEII